MAVKILVVDDSSPMRAVIIKTIKASGFGGAEFHEAANGREALVVLKSNWLDLVITDYNMPDMDGMALIREMKKDEILTTIPILVVTTEGSREKVDAFIESGATGYVKKPFCPEEIRSKLTDILGLGVAENDEASQESDDGFDF
jgi:two-component system chemotaxis response regulator CheY